MNNIIEVCKNLKKTIDSLQGTTTVGNSSLYKNNPWESTKASKSKLQDKLESLMKKNNITYEQLK